MDSRGKKLVRGIATGIPYDRRLTTPSKPSWRFARFRITPKPVRSSRSITPALGSQQGELRIVIAQRMSVLQQALLVPMNSWTPGWHSRLTWVRSMAEVTSHGCLSGFSEFCVQLPCGHVRCTKKALIANDDNQRWCSLAPGCRSIPVHSHKLSRERLSKRLTQ